MRNWNGRWQNCPWAERDPSKRLGLYDDVNEAHWCRWKFVEFPHKFTSFAFFPCENIFFAFPLFRVKTHEIFFCFLCKSLSSITNLLWTLRAQFGKIFSLFLLNHTFTLFTLWAHDKHFQDVCNHKREKT